MTLYQPATAYSDAIKRPPCPQCGSTMLLARIEPDKPGHDRRTFQCGKCGHCSSEVVKYK
jgi:ribosomal protein S27AE